MVLGSAVGPLLAGLFVEALGYRAMFGLLSATAGLATLIVLVLVPETLSAIGPSRQPTADCRQPSLMEISCVRRSVSAGRSP